MKSYIKLIKSLPLSVKWFFVTELLYGFAMGIWGVNLNFHLIENGFSNVGIGGIIAIGSIITAVVSLMAGWLCHRVGLRTSMVLGCVIRGLGIVIMAVSRDFVFLLIGQVLSSVGGAFILTTEFPLLLNLMKDKSVHLAYNVHLCVSQTAMLLGNIAAGFMPMWFNGYFGKYGMSIMLCGVLFYLMGIARYSVPKSCDSKNFAPISFSILKNPMVLSFLVYLLLEGIKSSILLDNSLINTVFRNSFYLSDNKIGILYSISTFVSAAAFFVAPIILNKWKRSYVITFILAANVLFFVVLAYANTVSFVLLWLLFSFINAILLGTAESGMLQNITEGDRGMYCGLAMAIDCIGISIGASLSGWLLGGIGYTGLIILGGICCILQLITYVFSCRKHLELEEEFDFEWQEI